MDDLPRCQRRKLRHLPDGLTEDGSQFTADEVEFMMAMDRYKREHRRPYPTWKEVYDVFKSLGYRKSCETSGSIRS